MDKAFGIVGLACLAMILLYVVFSLISGDVDDFFDNQL